MRHPPTPIQRTYRGRIRADMRSAANHLQRLINWDNYYRAKPLDYYPNQLDNLSIMAALSTSLSLLNGMLASKGPIPSR